MRKILGILFVAVVLGVMFNACNTAGCTENTSSIPEAGFYIIDSAGKQQAVKLDSLRLFGIGAPNDSAIVKPGSELQLVYLPLRSDQATTSFCFTYEWEDLSDPKYNDTLQFVYTSHPWLVSEECGASYRYRITQMLYTRHIIDSVAILDSMITNLDRETIRIFFKQAVY